MRAEPDATTEALAREVTAHVRRLTRLGLRPADLGLDTTGRTAVGWATLRIPLLLPPWIAVAVVGWLLFVVPYQLTGVVVDRFTLERDTRSSWKLLIGAALYAVWVVALAIAAGLWLGWWFVPAGAGDRPGRAAWCASGGTAPGPMSAGGRCSGPRRRLVETLRQTQHNLGRRLDQLFTQHPPRGSR